jgi:hypothetical protein
MHARIASICTSVVFILSVLPLFAADHTTKKKFEKSVPEVYSAAERAALRMVAEIEKRDAAGATLTFGSSRSVNQGVSGYRALFIAAPDTKSGKTIASLRIQGVVWSQSSVTSPGTVGNVYVSSISSRFFRILKQELGLSKSSNPPLFNSSGGFVVK